MSDYRRWFVPGGTYFFTVVTHSRTPIFQDKKAQELLTNAWAKVKATYPFTNIASVLLPDHFHCLWTLPQGDHDFSIRLRSIKTLFTSKWVYAGGHESKQSKSRMKRGYRGVWQRRFWEHTIRDQRDLENHFDYIHYNPVKHGYVTKTAEWPHSSFHRYVASGHYHQDWGNSPPQHLNNLHWE